MRRQGLACGQRLRCPSGKGGAVPATDDARGDSAELADGRISDGPEFTLRAVCGSTARSRPNHPGHDLTVGLSMSSTAARWSCAFEVIIIAKWNSHFVARVIAAIGTAPGPAPPWRASRDGSSGSGPIVGRSMGGWITPGTSAITEHGAKTLIAMVPRPARFRYRWLCGPAGSVWR